MHRAVTVVLLIVILSLGFVFVHLGAEFKPAMISAMFLVLGAFVFMASLTRWEVVWNNEKCQDLVARFGEVGARAIHFLFGVATFAFGLWLMFDNVPFPK